MPYRKIPLVNGEFYHILNRGIASQPVFLNHRDYQRIMNSVLFYQNANLPLKYSRFLSLPLKERESLWKRITTVKDFLVEIIAFSFMPNHFHFLLRQTKENGIREFIGNLINSYTKYFNIKRKREGPLFQGRFKAIRLETEEQLWHLSRYIHLQPYTSFIVKTLPELNVFPYSSFPEYLEETREEICSKEIILNSFKTSEKYKQFVFDNADYQRKLEKIKHLLLEKE